MTEKFQLVASRQRKLLELINTNSAANVNELAEFFGVSEATVRRDLSAMEGKGLLARSHGGAVTISPSSRDTPREIRSNSNVLEKLRIGQEALKLLHGDETVFLDAGTTAVLVASELAKQRGCTFITSSLGVANILAEKEHPHIYLVGGNYHPINQAFGGKLAINAINEFSFDIAFLCVASVDVERCSISIALEPYSQVQQKVISVSRRSYVIADHTKFKPSAFSVSAGFNEIDGVITGTEVDKSVARKCATNDLELILA
ncbi:MAG: DeoR/GlpR family DNA-binding transcription regulator [Granulosicoccus sp.]